MRCLFFLIVLCFASWWNAQTVLDCQMPRLSVFPSGPEIQSNSLFIIEDVRDDEILLNLNTKYPIYLKSGEKRTEFTIKEIHKGDAHAIQAVLVPSARLEVGREYELIIDSLKEEQKLDLYTYPTTSQLTKTYKVVSGEDHDPPVLSGKQRLLYTQHIGRMCTMTWGAFFEVPVKDTTEFIVKAILKRFLPGRKSTYYFKSFQNQIFLGRGVCYAIPFALEPGQRAKVTFSVIDPSGNSSAFEGRSIRFKVPRKTTSPFKRSKHRKKKLRHVS